jgi:hypothetical protein
MSLETRIQMAIVRADMVLCEAGKILLYGLAAIAAGALIGLAMVVRKRRRW